RAGALTDLNTQNDLGHGAPQNEAAARSARGDAKMGARRYTKGPPGATGPGSSVAVLAPVAALGAGPGRDRRHARGVEHRRLRIGGADAAQQAGAGVLQHVLAQAEDVLVVRLGHRQALVEVE